MESASLTEECLLDLESAKELSQIRLLVVGMGGLGAVVVRNAVKSGFKSVTMMDHKDWTEEDRAAQFLIPPECSISDNRAEASLVRAQTLNRKVQVNVETYHVSEVDETFFKDKFDVVVSTFWELEDIFKLNYMCRSAGIKFYAAHVFGLFGFIFADLLDNHCYQKAVRGIFSPYGGKMEKTVTLCQSFSSFDTVVNYSYKTKDAFNDSNPWYFIMRGFLKFGLSHGRLPAKDEPGDFETVKELVNIEVESSFAKDDRKVPDSYIMMTMEKPVPVICQTVGSVLSNEIVKAMTRKDDPCNNLYLFDPSKMKGQTVSIY